MAAKGSTAKVINLNARIRMLNGVVVKPCFYNGTALGHGKYFTGEVNGKLVTDSTGKPLPFHSIGKLELING